MWPRQPLRCEWLRMKEKEKKSSKTTCNEETMKKKSKQSFLIKRAKFQSFLVATSIKILVEYSLRTFTVNLIFHRIWMIEEKNIKNYNAMTILMSTYIEKLDWALQCMHIVYTTSHCVFFAHILDQKSICAKCAVQLFSKC